MQKFAVKRASEVYEVLRGEWLKGAPDRSVNDLTFIGHQANLRMLEAVARRCEVPEGQHVYNVDVRGNVGASGAPSVFSENWESQRLAKAIALCVVGSGLTWAGALFERA